MSRAERDAFIGEVNAALSRQAELMPEGLPHGRSRFGVQSVLGDFFERLGRKIFLASDLSVIYPQARAFAPDIIAVRDVEDYADDRRMAWVVAEEGRGIDLALEIVHSGDRQKDLYQNVIDYAELGIPEYFVFDRLKERLYGYRLPALGYSRRYEPIRSRGGLLHSEILDLDLGLTQGRLQFEYAGAVVPETRELLARVSGMVEDLERRAQTEAQTRAELEARLAERDQRLAEAERRAQAEAQLRAELEARIAELTRSQG